MLGQQFQYILSLPGRFLNLPKGGAGNWLRDTRDSLTYRGDPAVAKRVKVAETAQYSQIHLTGAGLQTPLVIHIGTTIGRSSSDVTVGTVGSTRLRFSQIEPVGGAHISLKVVYSRETVFLDGKPVSKETPMKDGAIINLGKQMYHVRLFAWDRTPVVIRVNAGWATSTGAVRESNEDAIGLYQHKRGYLFALADGVGGAQHGEQMSAFAIYYLLAVFNRNIPYDLDWEAVLGRAYQNINAEIRNFVKRSAFSAGTTLTSMVIQDWEASIAHVGDSRLYHWRGDTLTQITRDHARREPVINNTRHANETRTPAPMRDILEKAIGKTDEIQPDLINLRLLPGDKLLLCSDGVSGVITLEELGQLVAVESAKTLADTLVRLANEKGTKDNASAVVVEVMREGYVEDIWRAREADRVYVGYRNRPLRLGKPDDKLETQYPEQISNRRWAVGVVLILLLAFWLFTATRTNQPNLPIVPTASASPTMTATVQATVTAAPPIETTETPFIVPTVPGTPELSTPDLPVNGTPSPLSSARRTAPDMEQVL